jgi:hypothetical protein
MKKFIPLWSIFLIPATIILSVFLSPYFIVLMFLYFPLTIFYTESQKYDEREIFIRYRAGYLTFQLSIFLFIVLFINQAITTKTNPDPIYYLLIIIPTIVYTMFLLLQRYDLATSGRIILYIFGGWWILFSILSNGLTIGGIIQSSIGVGFIIPAFLSHNYRKAAALLCFLYATFVIFFFIRGWKGTDILLLMLFVFPIPLYYSGIVFLHKKGG